MPADPASPAPAGAPRGAARRLLTVVAALLASAGALAGSAALGWYAADVPAPGRAPVRVAARGADLLPGLDAAALLALAAVAAAVALGGIARRLLGIVLVLVAVWVGAAVAGVVAAPPDGAALAALPGAPAGAGLPVGVAGTAAPLLAGVGVLLLAAAGVLLGVRERGLARLGARYAAARPGGTDPGAEHRPAPREADPDRSAWEALDAGRDPTADP